MINTTYDCIIIGAGAAGMSAALYLKRANINFIIIEKKCPGGTLNKIKNISNYPGYTDKSGSLLAFNMYSQLEALDVEIKLDEVISIVRDNILYKIKTIYNEYYCKYIILASGKILKKFKAINSEQYENKGISYCPLCDGNLYKNKNVAVVGNSRSSIEACFYLSKIVDNVYLINKENKFICDEDIIKKILENDKIKILYNSEIEKICGDNKKISKVILNDNSEIVVEGIFVCMGNDIGSGYYQNLLLDSDKYGIIVNENMRTNKENIYAVGDCISKRLYQVVTAACEGAKAAHDIIRNIQNK